MLLVTGCASQSMVTLANGETQHRITCGIAVPEACDSEAAQICPKGYNIIQTESGNFWGMQPRILTVACK